MQAFKRKRTLVELRREVTKRGWSLNTDRYVQGDDHVSFYFNVKGTEGLALINIFNGKVFGHLNDGTETRFTSDNDTHENQDWFRELLKVAYVRGKVSQP
jgi:hypothetical protein